MSIVFFLLLTVNKRRKLNCMLHPRAKFVQSGKKFCMTRQSSSWPGTVWSKVFYDQVSLEQSFSWPGTSGAKFFMTRYTLEQRSAWLGRSLEQSSEWPSTLWIKVQHDQAHSWAKFFITRYTFDQSSSWQSTVKSNVLYD